MFIRYFTLCLANVIDSLFKINFIKNFLSFSKFQGLWYFELEDTNYLHMNLNVPGAILPGESNANGVLWFSWKYWEKYLYLSIHAFLATPVSTHLKWLIFFTKIPEQLPALEDYQGRSPTAENEPKLSELPFHITIYF